MNIARARRGSIATTDEQERAQTNFEFSTPGVCTHSAAGAVVQPSTESPTGQAKPRPRRQSPAGFHQPSVTSGTTPTVRHTNQSVPPGSLTSLPRVSSTLGGSPMFPGLGRVKGSRLVQRSPSDAQIRLIDKLTHSAHSTEM